MSMLQKRGVILAAAILLLTTAAFGVNYCIRRTPAAIAQASVDGTIAETLDLSRDTEITVTPSNGDIDHLIVKDGEIRCSETNCPDKVCAHQGRRHLNSDTTMCLPNRTVITITGEE